MRALRLAISLVACTILSAHSAAAQRPLVARMVGMGTIDGIVTDTMLVPLTGATVSILGSSIRVVTGDNGRFRISALESGQFIVIAQRIGYEPLSTRVNVSIDTERVSFALERASTTLDTVRVAAPKLPARLDDFESRLKNHDASAAFTAEDIHKVNPVDAWQMLSRVPSVKFIPKGKNLGLFATSTRGGAKGGPCYMAVMIDGVTMLPNMGDPAFDLANLPRPDEIHGIEVFAGPARMPIQYNNLGGNDNGTSKMCGLIAIWTR